MRASRSYPRSLLVILLVAGCVAAAIAPMLLPVQAAPVRAIPPNIIISEFRTRGIGPTPQTDEFVELFNPTAGPLTIGLHWKLERSDQAGNTGVIYDFPADVTLVAGQHYLIGGQTYSGSVTPDVPLPSQPLINIGIADDGGVGLLDASNRIIDGVGMFNTAMFVEGTPLTPLTGSFDQSYDRVQDAAGICQDTDHNASDFFLRSPSDPQNMASAPGTCGGPTQTISGNVTGVAGAVLTYTYFSGPGQKRIAGVGGAYSFTVPKGSTGTVVPSKPGYVFTPLKMEYGNIQADQTAQDYAAALSAPTATPIPNYGSVLINEVAYGGTQARATDQWIELYNPNAWDLTLTGWYVTGMGGTNSKVTLNGIIGANCYLVVAKNSTMFQLPLPTVGGCRARLFVDGNLLLSTSGSILGLFSNTGALIDTANANGGVWPAGVANPDSGLARRSMELHGRQDTDGNWYTWAGTPPSGEITRDRDGNLVRGSPGQANWASIVTATPSPVPTKYKTPTAPPPTPFAHMVLNEFLPRAGHDYNQDGTVDVYDEFIEVKNLGPINVNLSGWKIDVISSAGSSSYSLPSKVLQPDQRAVYYGSVTHISLHDSGGTVRLTNTRGIIIDARGYAPVNNPDQSTCRLPDGYYWRFPCFPTPGNENSQTGTAPIPPPNTGGHPAPCLLADTVPDAFRLAECNGFGSDIFNAKYWDDQSGFKDFPVLDMLDKWLAIVK